jgi:small GTP-binding protein
MSYPPFMAFRFDRLENCAIIQFLYRSNNFFSVHCSLAMHVRRAFKVILCGNTGVGKTSIIFWLLNRRFVEGFHPTIGPSVFEFPIDVRDRPYELKVWDTAGQERYRSLAPFYFRDATAALIVFGATDEDPGPSLSAWIAQFRGAAPHGAHVFVVANKIDLVDDLEPIATLGTNLKDGLGVEFFLVSAKLGSGVLELFQAVAKKAAESDIDPIEVRLQPQISHSCC